MAWHCVLCNLLKKKEINIKTKPHCAPKMLCRFLQYDHTSHPPEYSHNLLLRRPHQYNEIMWPNNLYANSVIEERKAKTSQSIK